ncbi:MAG TPA: glycoside hydrolase 43 family protein [Pyrinomonadaceae bacterium]|nr:glycoside hydrolase 43 family protein [Pyrinomonadaceae bacterium]
METLSGPQKTFRSALFLLMIFVAWPIAAQTNRSRVWVADNGDGTYRNPILHADYSDPDVIRVGDDFYLVASSFNAAPGLPILHSRDLVNWSIIGHALPRQPPLDVFSRPQHGNGVWAPAIRYHNGEFYIFYPDPDYGIYLVKAKDPTGPWSEPLLIKAAKGWIDPCPFWDDDGKAYLVSAFARSRSGIKSLLVVSRLSEDGTKMVDEGALVFDGHEHDPTVEGPKLYKRNGYYYIFAPAGGVEGGWQLVLRSKNIYGPYERRVVLAQGKTSINGPHQGAWIDTPSGESWFIHFQDKGAYGRVVHLQPMKWIKDWPLIGNNPDGNGVGEPVLRFQKPGVSRAIQIETPADSDEFDSDRLGLQWQWQANPQPNWAFPSAAYGRLRLFSVPLPPGAKNLWDAPNLLLQKFPAPSFTVTTKVTFSALNEGERTGLIVMGMDYAYVSLQKKQGGLYVSQAFCRNADKGTPEEAPGEVRADNSSLWLRVIIQENAVCNFSFSNDGKSFTAIGQAFKARQGRWIGAKVGIFAVGSAPAPEMGYADFDWFRLD